MDVREKERDEEIENGAKDYKKENDKMKNVNEIKENKRNKRQEVKIDDAELEDKMIKRSFGASQTNATTTKIKVDSKPHHVHNVPAASNGVETKEGETQADQHLKNSVKLTRDVTFIQKHIKQSSPDLAQSASEEVVATDNAKDASANEEIEVKFKFNLNVNLDLELPNTDVTMPENHLKSSSANRIQPTLDRNVSSSISIPYSGSFLESAPLETSNLVDQLGTRGGEEIVLAVDHDLANNDHDVLANDDLGAAIAIGKVDRTDKPSNLARLNSENNSCLENPNISQDLFTATLPRGNCQKNEDDLRHSNPMHNSKDNRNLKLTKSMKISPRSKRKVLIKNEKKVDRGELDEIFDRIRMKKKLQKEKLENTMKIEVKKHEKKRFS